MRFHRSDWPGIALAALSGPVLMIVFLDVFETWDHHGTPLLGAMAGNFAIGAGLVAVFSRFVHNWRIPIGLLVVLAIVIVVVAAAQLNGNDDDAFVTALKGVGVVDFLLLNVAMGYQMVTNGLVPVLNRRRAAEAE